MTIVYRQTKGSALSYAELDGNFSDLAGRTDLSWVMDGLEPTLRDGVGNPCELATFVGNTTAYQFVNGSVSEAFVNWDVPFNWATGTDLYAAIHWSPRESTATGNVRWGFEFVSAPVNGTFPTSTTFFYVLGAADGTAYRHIQSVSAPYPGASVVPNQRFLIRVFRDGADPADTFPADAYMVGVDFYYQVNKFGTPSYTPPYT